MLFSFRVVAASNTGSHNKRAFGFRKPRPPRGSNTEPVVSWRLPARAQNAWLEALDWQLTTARPTTLIISGAAPAGL